MAVGQKAKIDADADAKRNVSAKQADNLYSYSPAKQLNSREQSSLDQIEEGLNQDGGLEDLENNAGKDEMYQPPKSDDQKRLDGGINSPKFQKAIQFAKKRGGLFGLIALFGVSGGLLAFIFGPGSMLINLMQNMTFANDTVSPTMQRRIMRIFDHVAGETNNAAVCASSKIRCHMGKFTHHALNKMRQKGFVPIGADGNEIPQRRRGTVDNNPARWRITTESGRVIVVNSGDLRGFLSQPQNREIAAKLLGTRGAFNLRFRAVTSKYLKRSFYNKFLLNKRGGLADGSRDKRTTADMRRRITDRLPGAERIRNASANIRQKVTRHMGKARKGGAVYSGLVAGCIGVKAPGYIAAGVVAVQLAQLLTLVQDMVLSPAGKTMAAGFESDVTPEDVENIGNTLIETTDQPDGRKLSALDSGYLHAAMGISTTRMTPNADFAPGLAVLRHPIVINARQADQATEQQCNFILSEKAMYTAAAVSTVATVALSATIVGGLAKTLLDFAVSAAVGYVVGEFVEDLAQDVLMDIAENEKITQARGLEMGHALGHAGEAYFSAAGMARNLPVLKMSQVEPFEQMRREEENFSREMDIASLSPFDTSSRYTFLGSILHNTRTAMLANGNYNNSLGSIVSSVASLPSLAISPKAGAQINNHTNACNYANDFGLSISEIGGGLDPGNTPAINFAGMPCTGITDRQAGMSTEEAIQIAVDSGWLNEGAEFDPNSTIIDLIETTNEDNEGNSPGNGDGYIVANTPLHDFIVNCGDPSTGNIIVNAPSCTVNEDGGSYVTAEGNEVQLTARQFESMAVFLIDFQVWQMMNGFDEEHDQSGTRNGGDGGAGVPDGGNGGGGGNGPVSTEGWAWPMVDGVNPGPCYGRNVGSLGQHAGMDMNSATPNAPIFAMKDGTVHSVTSGGAGGNMVIIRTDDNIYYGLQHLSSISVGVGQRVTVNQRIGTGGKTGRVWANDPVHLHITTSRSAAVPGYGNLGVSFNPMDVLGGVPAPNGYRCY